MHRAKTAWARLADVPLLAGCQVIVRPDSYLSPVGWIGLLVIGDSITAAVPRRDLVPPVTAALDGLAPAQVLDPDVVSSHLGSVADVLGPAGLFYPQAQLEGGPGAEEVPVGALSSLIAAAPRDELDESGIEHLSGSAMVVRSGGEVIAACGHRRWPNGVAHLSVLTHPQHRRMGHADTVARAAIQRAVAAGLLPQWRARVEASRHLAKKLGLTELGGQLSLRPA